MSVTTKVMQRGSPEVATRPPGEPYYRHPGDVVRLALWAAVLLALLALVELTPETAVGLRSDLGRAATGPPRALRQAVIACLQVGAVLVPIAIMVALVIRRRWRRMASLVAAATIGAVVTIPLRDVGAGTAPLVGALETWPLWFWRPSTAYIGAVVAAAAVGTPWLSRRWRRVVYVAVTLLVVAVAAGGTYGAPELGVAIAAGGLAGAAFLVALGAPNRSPTTASIIAALGLRGLDADGLELVRATSGRSQLYRTPGATDAMFVKVYGRDSRDADLLYRSYRRVVLRRPGEYATSLRESVEHEALVLLLAERAGVRCPTMLAVAVVADGSMVLAMSDVHGVRLDELAPEDVDDHLLRAVWTQIATFHGAGLAHGALRAANVLVDADGRTFVIDVGAGSAAADARAQAIDRAELLCSIAGLVGPETAVRSASAVLLPRDLGAAVPYLQPLALSAATRGAVSKATLRDLRDLLIVATGLDAAPLERLVRVRPRTLLTLAACTGAFYVLLPQLAHVDESVAALGSANWGWLVAATATSALTYVAAAIGTMGGVRDDLPFAPTVQVALASSFVNRVTPANVGGMALNVRFLQKVGVPPSEAVTGVGLNVLAGGVIHVGLLAVFLTWSRRDAGAAFAIPSSSTVLVAIAVALALVGLILTTRRGRGLARAHVVPPVRQSLDSVRIIARSPLRLAELFGGSVGVTLAYVVALACAIAAFRGGISLAEIGAVYLGASLIAAAAPTPGGLGALEAALVAGLTGVGMDPGRAVAAVLGYRLLTFWLPVIPGWICFRSLERRNYI